MREGRREKQDVRYFDIFVLVEEACLCLHAWN